MGCMRHAFGASLLAVSQIGHERISIQSYRAECADDCIEFRSWQVNERLVVPRPACPVRALAFGISLFVECQIRVA